MLFDVNTVKQFMSGTTGVFHIGAHDCEEDSFYKEFTSDIVWIDAMEEKVVQGKERGHNIFHATVTDQDDQDVVFKVSKRRTAIFKGKTSFFKMSPWIK